MHCIANGDTCTCELKSIKEKACAATAKDAIKQLQMKSITEANWQHFIKKYKSRLAKRGY